MCGPGFPKKSRTRGLGEHGVPALRQMLGVHANPQPVPELLPDVPAQRLAGFSALHGDLLGRRPGGVQELEEEGAPRRSRSRSIANCRDIAVEKPMRYG